ncbi:hypothetical protein [Amycolatopsis thermophila]|uniref:Uncharacterized protein n=1 Tax=Amycolatopsis thermophila TaxID=206084 RepID=A0ABU0EMH2_9PSEU|nr:hypothetical protein [Amycolatopsis thermophila]MDQ0376484.1 hypothetical protein [Amycolatopsis thermophila]
MAFQGNDGCGADGDGELMAAEAGPVAATGLCLADGTPIAVVAVRDDTGAVSTAGWLDLGTGAFTAGPPPATALPCSATAETQPVEVAAWCDLNPDGAVLAPVVVAYEFDDTGQITGAAFYTPDGRPYTLQGTLGACDTVPPAGRSLVQLCDTAPDGTVTAFVRDYERDDTGAVTGFADYTLAGNPYTPAGAVGACGDIAPCDSPTTPAATTGLCLADGTPIATITTRDCDGVTTQAGWINLLTGAFTAGQPPAGARACGSAQSIQVSGTFCDVDPSTQDVLGLVLVEYQYAADGSIDSVRLVDASTGGTYTLQGELTVCPAGAEQPSQDATVLCDTAPDGSVTQFVRDYRRDENGAIVSHTDYTLDGNAYTASGEIGLCDSDGPECPSTSTLVLCDSAPQDAAFAASAIDPTPYFLGTVANTAIPLTDAQALFDGGTAVFPAPTTSAWRFCWLAGDLSLVGGCPQCGNDGDVTLTVSVQATLDGPNGGDGSDGGLQLYNGATSVMYDGSSSTPVGQTNTYSVTATLPLADVVAGQVRVVLGLETSQGTPKQWTIHDFTVSATVTAPGCGNQFVRAFVRDCTTGQVTTTDTDLAGNPYTPVEPVAQCQPHRDSCSANTADSCLDCRSVVLCDITPGPAGAAQVPPGSGNPTGTLANGVGYTATGATSPVVGQPWWAVDVPGPQVWTFDQPVRVAWSVRLNANACLVLPEGTVVEALHPAHTYDAGTRTVCGGAGASNNDPEQVSRFSHPRLTTLTLTPGGSGAVPFRFVGLIETGTPDPVPFLRHLCSDCNGAIVSTTDTTLDGQPYQVQGEAGSCGSGSGSAVPAPCPVAATFEQRRCDDTDGDGDADTTYTEVWSVPCDGSAPQLVWTYQDDPSIQYTPVAPVQCPQTQPATAVQARLVEISDGGTWDLTAHPLAQSVTLTNVSSAASTVTTVDGAATLHPSQTITWSVQKDSDLVLRGPLTVAAGAGSTVTVAWTERA